MRDHPPGKTAMILGASGKIGYMLCDIHMKDQSYPLVIRPVSRRSVDGHAPLVWALGDPVPKTLRCDVVVAVWGVTHGSAAELDKNTTLAKAAMDWARATGADRVLHCSSVAVYPPTPGPFAETHAVSAETPYGLAKADMERAVSDSPDVRSVVLRIGSVAGADSLFAAGRRTGSVTLDRFADGCGPLRSYIGPRDFVTVISALCHAPQHALPAVVNVAAARPMRMEDMARAMGWSVRWRTAPPGARQSAILDTTCLQSLVRLPADASDPLRMARDVRQHWRLT